MWKEMLWNASLSISKCHQERSLSVASSQDVPVALNRLSATNIELEKGTGVGTHDKITKLLRTTVQSQIDNHSLTQQPTTDAESSFRFTYINECMISQAHQFQKKSPARWRWASPFLAVCQKPGPSRQMNLVRAHDNNDLNDLCIVQDSKPKTQRKSTIINVHNYNSNASCLWDCAPFSSKSRRIATFPVRHAICNAVRRVSVVLASLSAPASIKRRTTWAERCAQRRSESCRVLFFDT